MSDAEVKIINSAELVGVEEPECFMLKRGEQANLTRIDPTLKTIQVGVGWDVIGFDNEAPDLDASVFLLDKNNMTAADEDFIFYNNLQNLDGSAKHLGDNRTGAGDGDDEAVLIDLMALPFTVQSAVFVISIYDAALREQSFKNAQLMRFNLDKEFEENPNATALIVGTLQREGANWFFEGQGKFENEGLRKIATDYGIVVAM